MSKVYTNWTEATTDVNQAMVGLISCIESGKNAWIEVRKNGDQVFPIMRKNPLLDNPFNWTMDFGTMRSKERTELHSFFNDTERDLTENWVACFGKEEAVEEYQKNGVITQDLILGSGICHPVRIEDANLHREKFIGDGYKHGCFMTFWKPKNNIPYKVVDDSISEVFTICYTNEPFNKKEAIQKAAQFLMSYAERVAE